MELLMGIAILYLWLFMLFLWGVFLWMIWTAVASLFAYLSKKTGHR